MESESIERITGSIKYFRFKKENGWAVVKFQVTDGLADAPSDLVVVGHLGMFQEGETLECLGHLVDDGTWGLQFQTSIVFRATPQNTRQWSRYLQRNIKGVGPVQAGKILQYFGLEIEAKLDPDSPLAERESIYRLLGKENGRKFLHSWDEDKVERTVGLVLAELGLSDAQGHRVLEIFGANALSVLKNKPYQLTRVHGIGFKIADGIALQNARQSVDPQDVTGMAEAVERAKNAPERARAALLYTLEELARQGHSMYPREDMVVGDTLKPGLLSLVVDKCEIRREQVEEALAVLADPLRPEGGWIKTEKLLLPQAAPVEYLFLRRFYQAERDFASDITRLMTTVSYRQYDPAFITSAIQQAEAEMFFGTDKRLHEQQRQAILMALRERVSLILGKAGTGKTSTLTALIKVAKLLKLNFLLCAPTGRARKRLSEVTGEKAQTIHKALDYNPEQGGFQCNRNKPLTCDLLVVDEASMLGILLGASLGEAIPDGCCLVFVGDEHQLPSVEAGKVLIDMILSKRIPLTRLSRVHRQEEAGLSLNNAHRILEGQMPVWKPVDQNAPRFAEDAYFLPAPKKAGGKGTDPDKLKELLRWLVQEGIPGRMPDIDPMQDIQILSLQKKGPVGMYELNSYLQSVLNPQPEEKKLYVGKRCFHLRDRVMVTENNTKKDIANGDIGTATDWNTQDKEMCVNLYDREVLFDFKDAKTLELAYDATVHKAQGSEFPVTILLMLPDHFTMLHRHLFYTGSTRHQKLIFTIGTKDSIRRAVTTCEVNDRKTFLMLRLRKLLPVRKELQKAA